MLALRYAHWSSTSELSHRHVEPGRVVENKCIMAYDDTSGKMAKAFDSALCNFDCYSGTFIDVVVFVLFYCHCKVGMENKRSYQAERQEMLNF